MNNGNKIKKVSSLGFVRDRYPAMLGAVNILINLPENKRISAHKLVESIIIKESERINDE
jgi:hypothetical protein